MAVTVKSKTRFFHTLLTAPLECSRDYPQSLFCYLIVILEEVADFPVKIILIDCLLFKGMLVLSSGAFFMLKLLAILKSLCTTLSAGTAALVPTFHLCRQAVTLSPLLT